MKRLKKILKGIGIVGVGLSTLAGATLAQTSVAYPEPFVKNGLVDKDALIVIGADAKASDTIGALDLMNDLKERTRVCTPNPTAGKRVLSGDTVSISESSDLLELYESIGDVKETLTEDDLVGLESDELNTGEGTTDYNQYLRFEETDGSIASLQVVYDENEDDEVGDYLFVNDGEVVFEYEMEFSDGLESDIDDGELEDLENERINILGQDYTIVNADIDVDTKNIELLFLGGSNDFYLAENNQTSFDVNGEEYNVKVLLVSDDDDPEDRIVKLQVNDEILDEMSEGETETLEDGTIVGVEDILVNDAEDGPDQVQGFIGANKLEFRDKYDDDAFSARVEINDENIEDGKVKIKGVESGTDEFEITSIKYRLEADADKGGDVFINPGDGLRNELDEPEGMFGNWDIVYEGLEETGFSEVKLRSSGDDEYSLQFENNRGTEYNIPFASTEVDFKYGDEDDELVFTEGISEEDGPLATIEGASPTEFYNIAEDSYFVVTEDNDETGNTHILRYESIDDDNNEITFNDEGSDSFEVTYEGDEGDGAEGEIVVGGNTYTFYVGAAPDYKLAVDLNNDGVIDGGEANIVVKGGGILDLNPVDGSELSFTLRTLASEFDEPEDDEEVNFVVSDSGDELSIDVDGVNLINHDNRDLESGMTPYGVYVEMEDDNDNDEPEDVTIEYPLRQRGVDVSVVFGETTTTTESAEVCTAGEGNVGHALDTEVEDVSAQNVLLIGGPAVNSWTASLLNMSYPSYGDSLNMTVGDSVVEMVDNGENIAMLVYGHSWQDTRAAIKELVEA